MWTSVAFALAAGMMWGIVFVGPLLFPDYPPALHAIGRYLAFGLLAVPLALLDRAGLRKLSRADWLEALRLSAIGNFIYYLCLASALQRAGGPLTTMIIGTLPASIAICANLRDHRRDGRLPWLRLAPSLLLIGAGIVCVNQAELGLTGHADLARHLSGIVLAVVAVACWTWYALRNADWLRQHAGRNPRAWATAQGLATLPMALAGYAVFVACVEGGAFAYPLPLGPRPLAFLGLVASIALLASWLGTLCWNEASQRLPTALAGQLLVFETLAGLAYTFLLRGAWPPATTLAGIGLLVGGVLWALRVKPISTLVAA
ncbi:MAG: DMT family transporter [Pseudomonadota bacterium]